MNIQDAIALIKKKYPNKRMYGNPGEWNGKFTFRFIDETETEEDAEYNAGVIAVDKNSGEISEFNAFANFDYFTNVKTITEY